MTPARAARLVPAVAAIIAASLTAAPAVLASATGAEFESVLVMRTNEERHAAGQVTLVPSGELAGLARRHAAEMAAAGRVFHTPDLRDDGGGAIGENVGAGPTGEAVHRGFMASPAHRHVILYTSFTEIGVGAVPGADGVVYVAELFRRPAAPPNPPSPVATATRAPSPAAAPPTIAVEPAPPPPTTAPPAPALATTPGPGAPVTAPRPTTAPSPDGALAALARPGAAPNAAALPVLWAAALPVALVAWGVRRRRQPSRP